jgi:hypothetical protein
MPDEFDAIISRAKRIVGASQDAATAAFPNGGHLRCATCGSRRAFTTAQGARYLTLGWPVCHGATMSLENQHA